MITIPVTYFVYAGAALVSASLLGVGAKKLRNRRNRIKKHILTLLKQRRIANYKDDCIKCESNPFDSHDIDTISKLRGCSDFPRHWWLTSCDECDYEWISVGCDELASHLRENLPEDVQEWIRQHDKD